jgi:hypothetical protein
MDPHTPTAPRKRKTHDLMIASASVLSEADEVIQRFDGMIERCGQLLDVLQPLEPGRIQIAWWARISATKEILPTPVVLSTITGGKWRLKQVPIKTLHCRIRYKGEFAKHAQHVAEVVAVVKRLLIARGDFSMRARRHITAIRAMCSHRTNGLVTAYTDLQRTAAAVKRSNQKQQDRDADD